LYDGQLVAEKYAPGFDRHTRLLSWSMAKTVTSALVGILVRQGKLIVDEPAPVPQWKGVKDGREKITLKHLLQQTSGLAFDEDYSKASNATNMLFREADMGAYTASLPLREEPGSRFYYSSGNTNILSGIIRRTVGDSLYYAFPQTELFFKTGIYSAVLEPDPAGNFVGSS
jgi:CubicO group peptidase (beta-lactamase class C family)